MLFIYHMLGFVVYFTIGVLVARTIAKYSSMWNTTGIASFTFFFWPFTLVGVVIWYGSDWFATESEKLGKLIIKNVRSR